MAQRNEKVYERVRQELAKNPLAGSRELYDELQKSDKNVGQDTLQQFHARYVLPVKREIRKAGGGTPGGSKRSGKPKRAKAAKAPRGRETVAAAAPSEAAPAAPRGGQRTGRVASERTDRDEVRSLLLQFAQELTDAESRSSLVKVLGKVDSYVNRIAKV